MKLSSIGGLGTPLFKEIASSNSKKIHQILQVKINIYIYIYMGVSKNRGTPKWMVYKGKPY